MKISFVFILFIFTKLACEAQNSESIDFANSSWSNTLQRAKNEKKAIFLYAYTPSCRWCRQMEKEVFTNQEVVQYYNSHFISYKINIEDGAEGEALAQEYAIDGFPTYVYFNKDGELMHQSGSAKPANDFIQDGKNAFNPQTALFSLKRKYDSGDRSELLLYNYSNALATYHQENTPEEKIVEEYLQTQSAKQLESEKNLTYIFTKALGFAATPTQHFLKNQDKFVALYGGEEVNRKAEGIIKRTASIAGRKDNAKLLQAVVQVIKDNFKDTSRLSALAEIYFYQGQADWLKYARATLAYSKSQGSDDLQTLYETSAYLNGFSTEREALEIGVEIMEKVIKMKSYEHLYLYAQLQKKIGRKNLAMAAAKEAVGIARSKGIDSNGAANFIFELQVEKEK